MNNIIITIEEINDKPMTVLWCNPYPRKSLEETAKDGLYRTVNHSSGSWRERNYDYIENPITKEVMLVSKTDARKVFAVALPPLPRNPTVADAKLLHLYAAHGLKIVLEQRLICTIQQGVFIGVNYEDIMCQKINGGYTDYYYFRTAKIIHTLDKQGNKVEVAIIDKESSNESK